MNNRTEPTKEENEAAIAELKRETRGKLTHEYSDARAGTFEPHMYSVFARSDVGMMDCRIADFYFDHYEGGRSREAARIMAEELAERINNV